MQTKIMKIYRTSIWKASRTKTDFFPLLIILLIGTPIVRYYTKVGSILFCALIFITFYIPLITQYFYIIITDKEIIIKNAILGFWKREYKFEDIISVKLEHTGGFTLPYMRVKVKNKKGWWKYVIDMVPPKEYKAMIKDIEDRNIPLEVKGMKGQCGQKWLVKMSIILIGIVN